LPDERRAAELRCPPCTVSVDWPMATSSPGPIFVARSTGEPFRRVPPREPASSTYQSLPWR